MNKLNISIRPAVWEDAEFLLALRNDPSVWSQFIQACAVGREEHLAWLKGVLQRNDVKLFIILNGHVAVGQVRYDIKQNEAFLSIAISANHRKQGFAIQALMLSYQKVFSLPNVMVLKALVQENNKASLGCFEKAGFSPVCKEKHEGRDFIVMELPKAS